ncbi:MAG: hypothetical protein C0497_03255 [Gemmatimonas sp.]|nr:hypothetical protein [Gemmatimonas sp.]
MIVALAGLAAACGGRSATDGTTASRATLRGMPGWYKKPPAADKEHLYQPATATSHDVQVAINRAQAEARSGLASQLEVKYGSLTRRFVEETGVAADAQLLDEYEQTYKAVVSQVLVGSHARDQKFQIDGGVYRAWVLMQLPVGEANRKLVEQIKAREQLYTRLRATEAFKELNAEVEQLDAARAGRRP